MIMYNKIIQEEHLQFYSDALCALTEIYMTDLCDEEAAESNCVAFMEEAMKRHPQNPEVYSTFASVRLSQCRNEEAKELVERGMDLWYTEPEEDKALVVDPAWPSFPSRMSLARLLIEVGSFQRALDVIETCEAEDEEDAQVWYLYGWSYMKLAETDQTAKDVHLSDAKDCLEQVLQAIVANVAK
jgi:predicted Zn-dependent protease